MTNLYDRQGRIRGRIQETTSKDYAYDSHGSMVGWYDKNGNKTYDSHGRYVGSGNQLSFLFD